MINLPEPNAIAAANIEKAMAKLDAPHPSSN